MVTCFGGISLKATIYAPTFDNDGIDADATRRGDTRAANGRNGGGGRSSLVFSFVTSAVVRARAVTTKLTGFNLRLLWEPGFASRFRNPISHGFFGRIVTPPYLLRIFPIFLLIAVGPDA